MWDVISRIIPVLDKESLKEIKGHKVIKKQENDLGGYFTGENFDILFLLIIFILSFATVASRAH